MIGKFELSQSGPRIYTFRLRASNGLVILSSRDHGSKQDALQGIESARHSAMIDACFERLVSARGEAYFRLMGAQGELIGSSQMYASRTTMEIGIASVVRNGPSAVLIDMASERRRAMLG